jgi:thiol-disulfide isomerase/thioredoxin
MSGSVARFLHGYYLANICIIVSYYATRNFFISKGDFSHSKFAGVNELVTMERQSLSLLGIALSLKFLRRQSLDGYFTDVFFFCKSVLAMLTWYIDYRWSIMYIFIYLCAAIAFPQPFYRGKMKIEELTPETFVEVVEGEKDTSVTWIIELYAHWSPQCLYLEPVIADISNNYGSNTVKFGKVDVSRWPSIAKKYRVNLNGLQDQLPTILRFRKGKEDGRIPQISEDGKKVYGGKFRKQDIIAAFELDAK